MGSRIKATNAHNSIAVCGDGVRGCHGFLQRHDVDWEGDAEGDLIFTPVSPAAQRWMQAGT